MEIRCAVDLHNIGLHEMLRISIRRGQWQNDALTSLNRTTMKLHLLFGDASNGHWRIHPQQFLDRSTKQFRLAQQPPAILWVRGQVPETSSDCAPRRVRTCQQYQKTTSQLMLLTQR